MTRDSDSLNKGADDLLARERIRYQYFLNIAAEAQKLL